MTSLQFPYLHGLLAALGLKPVQESVLSELGQILVLLCFTLTLLVGFVFMTMVLRRNRRQRELGVRDLGRGTVRAGAPLPAIQPGLEYPPRWLALRSEDLLEVQLALNLRNPTPCPLKDGLLVSQDHNLFLSPPLNGWIMVTGADLPDPEEEIDRFYCWLRGLSAKLPEVQYFSANRVLDHHGWVRLTGGGVFRAYIWTGEVLWNEGDVTAAERQLGMSLHDYGDSLPPHWDIAEYGRLTNSEKVPALAARWGLDPRLVYTMRRKGLHGLTGEMSSQ